MTQKTEIEIWATSLKKAMAEAQETLRYDSYREPDEKEYKGAKSFEFSKVECTRFEKTDDYYYFSFTVKY